MITSDTSITHTVFDFNGLAELRHSASKDKNDKETLKQVAGQFEALFINLILKGMRQAKLGDGLFDSSQSVMYREIADQQLAIDLSTKGGLGLQRIIMNQLGAQGKKNEVDANSSGGKHHAIEEMSIGKVASINLSEDVKKPLDSTETKQVALENIDFDSPEAFVESLWPMAKKAADKLGVEPEVILSQAALETGWGKHILDRKDGRSSYNLFNIKADKRWDGEYTKVGTVEYLGGVAIKEQAQFRVYNSYQQSFDDYVAFLQGQPRYRQALQQADKSEIFIDELYRAGYATDPAYPEKIKRIMRSLTLVQILPEIRVS